MHNVHNAHWNLACWELGERKIKLKFKFMTHHHTRQSFGKNRIQAWKKLRWTPPHKVGSLLVTRDLGSLWMGLFNGQDLAIWPNQQSLFLQFDNIHNKFKVVMMGFSENIFWSILATIKCFSMMKSEMFNPFSFVTITRVFLI